MPSYARFLDSEKISKRFWACRPRNPSCGLISLERGSKFWLWTSLLAFSIYGVRLAYLLFARYPLCMDETELQTLKKFIKNTGSHSQTVDLHTHPILAWFSKFIVCCLFGYYTWRLIEAIKARDVPKLKNRFIIMSLINFIWFPMLYFEILHWIDHLRVPHINIPAIGLALFFQIIGLAFTYSFISTLVSAPRDDSNNGRIGVNQPNNQSDQDNGDADGFNRI